MIKTLLIKNVRGADLFLITKEGKIVIPKRSGNRRIYPNCYDLSALGMVDSGEDYESTMYRELKIVNYDKDGIAQIYYLTTDEIDSLLSENPEQFKVAFKYSYNALKEYLKANKE